MISDPLGMQRSAPKTSPVLEAGGVPTVTPSNIYIYTNISYPHIQKYNLYRQWEMYVDQI